MYNKENYPLNFHGTSKFDNPYHKQNVQAAYSRHINGHLPPSEKQQNFSFPSPKPQQKQHWNVTKPNPPSQASQSGIYSSQKSVFMSNSRASQVAEDTIAFIYDIPKNKELFSNKSMTDFFTSNGFKGCHVQIIKDKVQPLQEVQNCEEIKSQKPYWSGRIKFKNSAYLEEAYKHMKYFTLEGFQLRLLKHDQNLSRYPQMPKENTDHQEAKMNHEFINPDNSDSKCNIVVKHLDPDVTDKDLEDYFSKFGTIKNCKVSKDPVTGMSKTYGFVWFEKYQEANIVMIKHKNGNLKWPIEWYKILSQRETCKFASKKQSFNDQIIVTWRRIDYDNKNMEGMTKADLENYFNKFGKIVDMEFQSDSNRAFIAFSSCDEAEFALQIQKREIKNHSVWAKLTKDRNCMPCQDPTANLLVEKNRALQNKNRLQNSFGRNGSKLDQFQSDGNSYNYNKYDKLIKD